MIDRDTVDRIYSAADIVEVISDYITLKRKGLNHEACCPFHNEKTPSFVVSPSKGIYKCFGCGKSGNAVTFVMEHESITYPEALRIVAKKYGIEIQEREQTEEDIQRNNNRESMFMLNSWASDYFAKTLHDTDEGVSVGLSYFRQHRGFSEATIRKFGLGFCPSGGDKMTQDALRAGYKEEFLLSTGLTLKREEDGRLYDRFRERVMFPVHNISGRIVAFGGRTLRTDKKVAKYQNSPESEIYSKSREIYGLYFAKQAIQRQGYAIMVEGYTDVISMHKSGVENVVASSGTSLTVEQVKLLGRFTKDITIMYDGDSAGQHASIRGIDLVLKEGLNVRVVLLPVEHDPDSFARAHSAEEVHEFIKNNSQDFIAFKAKLLLDEANNDPIKRSEAIKEMVQSIALVPDNIQLSLYITQCASLMSVDENIIIGEVARKRVLSIGDREAEEFLRREQNKRWKSRRDEEIRPSEDAMHIGSISVGSSAKTLEREILYYLLLHGDKEFYIKEGKSYVPTRVADSILDSIAKDSLSFGNKEYKQILAECQQWYEEGKEFNIQQLTTHPDHDVCRAAIDIIASDANYVESAIWGQREVHRSSEQEVLRVGVPKVLGLYRTKRITQMIEELQYKLDHESLTEEEELQITEQITFLLQIKVKCSRNVNRTTV